MNWGPSVVAGRACPFRRAEQQIYVHIRCRSRLYVDILSTFSFPSRESFEVIVSGGSTFARVKLKEIDGMAPQDVERAV